MLEDLKKEAAATSSGMQFGRLTVFVGGCVLLAALLVMAQTCGSAFEVAEKKEEPERPEDTGTAPVFIERDVLEPLVTQRVTDPDGGERVVETTPVYAKDAIAWMRRNVEGEPPSAIAVRTTPSVLGDMPLADVLGRVFEVEGEVVEVVEQRWGSQSGRLWQVVLEDAEGNQVVAIEHSLATDVGGGAPRDAYKYGGARRPILKGQTVLVRGYYLQRRTGTIGGSSLRRETPILWASAWRRRLHVTDRVPPVKSLHDIEWSGVHDRLYSETIRWEKPQLFEAVQWARSVGYDEIRRRIRDGEFTASAWDQDTFSVWQKEVDVEEGDERPFTSESRGQWFQTTGLIANTVHEGWNSVLPNRWGVDNVLELDLMSDYYGNWTIRNISAFPLNTYDEIVGERAEHVRIYGIFIQNFSYETRRRDDSGELRPLTMPMFLVMHIEPREYSADTSGWHQAMMIIAILIAVLGFTFYFLFARGERKDARLLEQKRIERRQAARAKAETKLGDEAKDRPTES